MIRTHFSALKRFCKQARIKNNNRRTQQKRIRVEMQNIPRYMGYIASEYI